MRDGTREVHPEFAAHVPHPLLIRAKTFDEAMRQEPSALMATGQSGKVRLFAKGSPIGWLGQNSIAYPRADAGAAVRRSLKRRVIVQSPRVGGGVRRGQGRT